MENHSPIQNPSTVAIPLTPGPDSKEIALQDPYILRQIFAHLRVPSLPLSRTPLPESPTIDQTSRSQTRRFLGRAALVCHAFSEPARDALWSSLDSLTPIFNVLNPGWQKRLDVRDTFFLFLFFFFFCEGTDPDVTGLTSRNLILLSHFRTYPRSRPSQGKLGK